MTKKYLVIAYLKDQPIKGMQNFNVSNRAEIFEANSKGKALAEAYKKFVTVTTIIEFITIEEY